ncbi:MAG: oligopeptide transporter, OPT family [Succinivibrio sp.]|nr:oligopeptide transporter, OPT family [Succinivibrio sp.]
MNNQTTLTELTFRGILLGTLITLVFTASNVYLGLKVGMTFASSIPAAVISMAVLRMFKDSSILENNIVQTQASAAGCISSVIFVMPALIMLGYWNGFPFGQTFLICAAGGVLGVIFTIPLRYAMVVKSSLPYPEGVAAAVILKTAEQDKHQGGHESREGVKLLVSGSLISSVFALCTNGFRVLTDGITLTTKLSSAVFTLSTGYSFALLGAGLLIGTGGGISMLLGVVLCWGMGVPLLTSILPNPDNLSAYDFAMQLWVDKIRLAGAGCIAIGAVWTLVVMLKPILKGLEESAQLAKAAKEDLVDAHNTDLSMSQMLWIMVFSLLIIGAVFSSFVSNLQMPLLWSSLFVLTGTLLAALIGFVLAAACGYMAGLIGSSSSPISGITIISVVIIALVYMLLSSCGGIFELEGGRQFVTAFTLFTATLVNAVASISNDNLQDLKTGLLVHASPKKQQIALIIGTIIGAMVIAPVLEILYNGYGFPGAMPREGMDETLALNAPQATLMASIVKGIFESNLDWTYIFAGLLLGGVLIAANWLLRRYTQNRMYLAPLAVGLGIYLPSSVNVIVIVGALASYFLRRYLIKRCAQDELADAQDQQSKRSNLIAAGLIVGESLMGVILAVILTLSISLGGSEAPLALSLNLPALLTGTVTFIIFICGCIYVVKKIKGKY